MVFHRGRRKSLKNIKLQMDDKIIKESPHIKYLGVILDNKLNWIEHIGYVKNKVAKGIGVICKARKFLTKKVLLTLYNTFIFPYLIYCVEIWGCAKKTHLASLYILQKRIVRTITFADKLAHTGPIFKNIEVLPLAKLIHCRIGLYCIVLYCIVL